MSTHGDEGAEEIASETLLASYATGDVDALRALYQRHEGELRGFVFWSLGRYDGWTHSRGEDVCVDVWRAVATSAKRFEGRSSFRAWIYGIAQRCCWGHRKALLATRERQARRPARGAPGLGEEVKDRSPAALDAVAAREVASDVSEALRKLPTKERKVFVLRAEGDLGWEEISDELEIPRSTIQDLMARAVKTLRSLMRRHAPEDFSPAFSRARHH